MTLTQSKLNQIIAQASNLSERLNWQLSENQTIDETAKTEIENRLDRWCQVAAQGDREKFQKRLNWDKLNLEKIKPLLTNNPQPLNLETTPHWATTLQQILETAPNLSPPEITPLNTEQFLPYQEILLPAIIVGRNQLLNRLNSSNLSPETLPLTLLSETAYLSLERSLLEQLINLSYTTFKTEFFETLPLGQKLLLRAKTMKEDTPALKAEYRRFCQQILTDDFPNLCEKYPVLSRLIATAVNFWVTTAAEFIEHLQEDLPDIEKLFSPQEKSGKISQIKTGLSDPHNNGKSVIALTFESGLKLIYKPKDLGTEIAYCQFLEWCNQQEIDLKFKVLKILNCRTRGWVEYVEHLPCENEAAARRFYQRAGMLLCLLYVFRVTDCHRENLVASGEHFVLIDMETILHHEVEEIAETPEITTEEKTIYQQFLNSVLRTGLLPRWDFTKDNRVAYDITALGYLPNFNEEQKELPTNVAFLGDKPLLASDYLEEIVTGFQQMYRCFLKQQKTLLSPNNPLAAMSAAKVRFVFRATRVYFTILQKLQHPKYYRNGIDRSIELDLLSRAFTIAPDKPNAWEIFAAEIKAMEQLDIPFFAAYPHSNSLSLGLAKPIEGYFQASSYEEAIALIKNLSETDLTAQIEIIKGSFYAWLSSTNNSPINQPPTADLSIIKNPQLLPAETLSKNQLYAEATRLAEEIKNRAIRTENGSIKWISFGYIPNAERFQLMPLRDDFYSGGGGIALFFAALDFVSSQKPGFSKSQKPGFFEKPGFLKAEKRDNFRELALGIWQSVDNFLETRDRESTRRFVRQGIGGATGLGSLIYCLVKTHQFLSETHLLTNALEIAELITPPLVETDRQFDILGGAAGAILGLLALYAATEEKSVLDKANLCGKHLLSHQTSLDNKPKAWQFFGKKQLTGFSHGAAGIAYSLLRLYAVTGNKAYLEAAQEGINYERTLFSPTVNNWQEVLDNTDENPEPHFMFNWCHGAPGIGLGRLGSLEILETEEIKEDIEAALQTTINSNWHEFDSVCCGSFGRIETLLVGAEKLGRQELKTMAEKRATWAISRGAKNGGFRFGNLPINAFSPSFFQGSAGVGYQLLRLAHPEVLPSVLLWS